MKSASTNRTQASSPIARLLGFSLLGFSMLGLCGCGTLEYDLGPVPIPVSAKPATADEGPGQSFEIKAKNILWFHGLFGHTMPDVAELVTEASDGYDKIASFRARSGPGFHDWLVTHLTLSLVRMKTVVISGELIGGDPIDGDFFEE